MINAKPRWRKIFIDTLNAAIAATVTAPSHPVKIKINGLIVRHERSGFWATRSIYYNFRHDGDEAFGFYNLIAPSTFLCLKNGATTFTSKTKVFFQGSAGYYNTQYALGTGNAQYGVNLHSVVAGITDNPGGSTFLWGCNQVGVRATIWDNGNGIRANCASGGTAFPTSGNINTGKFLSRRTSSSAISFNKNGAADGSATQNVTDNVLPSQVVLLGCRNNNGAANGPTGAGLSYWSPGNNISDALALQAYNDETAFEASL